ncbi:HAD family hydrolase [Mameliella alba]|uniref:HAD family hydrolase n=2 Tax=Mameliella alba TaxID=561184 RepID=UPI0020956A76|nr:HAD family hydrolase [Mameliella alba]
MLKVIALTPPQTSVLVRDSGALECMNGIDTFIMDKTGTLTEDRHRITDAVAAEGCDEETVLTLAAAFERGSAHPLAGPSSAGHAPEGWQREEPWISTRMPFTGSRTALYVTHFLRDRHDPLTKTKARVHALPPCQRLPVQSNGMRLNKPHQNPAPVGFS